MALRRIGGQYVRAVSVMTELLQRALANHKHHQAHKGNHEVLIVSSAPSPRYPDMEACAGCDRYLVCQSTGRISLAQFPSWETPPETEAKQYACQRQTQRIRFLYHGTCCIEYDMDSQMLTGHGTYGWSQSTNAAIGRYLGALAEGGYITPNVRYAMLANVRRDGKGTLDQAAPWYSTKEE